MLINMPSQQPEGQLQKQHIIQTYIKKENKRGTNETNTYTTKDKKKLKLSKRITLN